MELQYISDNSGNHTAVIIPIDKWNHLTTKYQELGELEKQNIRPRSGASRFKGLLTKDEAKQYDIYLKKARNEWERDI